MRAGSKPETIDDYLTMTSPEERAALQRLRRTIKAAAPNAEDPPSARPPNSRTCDSPSDPNMNRGAFVG